MISNIKSQLTAKRCFSARRLAKSYLILPIIGCVLACASCTDDTASSPIVDVTPLGDGLRVLAYAVLGVGALGVLGKLVK